MTIDEKIGALTSEEWEWVRLEVLDLVHSYDRKFMGIPDEQCYELKRLNELLDKVLSERAEAPNA